MANINFESLKVGDRLKVIIKNEYNKPWFKKLANENNTFDIEIRKINDGVNISQKNGTAIWKEYTTKKVFNKQNKNIKDSFDIVNSLNIKFINGDVVEFPFKALEIIEIGINTKFDKWINKAYDYANLNSKDDDCINIAINKYKALKELNQEKKDMIYNDIAKRLGFMKY